MKLGLLKGIGAFVLLLLLQALVLGHIHLFNCATPLLYVYMAVLFPRGVPRWLVLVACFLMGLCVDVFANTPGVAAASMTLVGLLQPYLLELVLPRESTDDLAPSVRSLGFGKFAWFALIIVFIYCLAFFSIEAFSFDSWIHWLECVGGSFAITSVLLLTIEILRGSNRSRSASAKEQ